MVEIQAEQIPATLRRTLSDVQFTGWEEEGTLYQDPNTNEYVLVMDKGEETSTTTESDAQSQSRSYRSDDETESKTYRFDRNGQLKEDQNETQDK